MIQTCQFLKREERGVHRTDRFSAEALQAFVGNASGSRFTDISQVTSLVRLIQEIQDFFFFFFLSWDRKGKEQYQF